MTKDSKVTPAFPSLKVPELFPQRPQALPSTPTLGGPNVLNEEWIQYRKEVRAIAEWWCYNPLTTYQDSDCIIEESCGVCPACVANDLIQLGEV